MVHALAYLTASKNGLSDAELEDVLSLDDVVLNDVFIHWIPNTRRCAFGFALRGQYFGQRHKCVCQKRVSCPDQKGRNIIESFQQCM